MKKRRRQPNFKTYNQRQLTLLPQDIDSLFDKNHPVRFFDQVVDGLNLDGLIATYKPTGASSYHPKLLLKVLLYAYLNNIYSTRKIERALKEDITFMWLAAGTQIDHTTIHLFRSERLAPFIKPIFTEIVDALAQAGLIDITAEVFTDGTTLEADANRYKVVWRGTIEYQKKRIKKQIEQLWKYAEQVNQQEQQEEQRPDFEEIDAQGVAEAIKKINAALEDKQIDPKVKKKLKKATKDYPERMAKYEEQERKLGDRKSYSKTDEDATFMYSKDDHFKSQTRACYNVLCTTQHGFALNFTTGQTPSDSAMAPAHWEAYEEAYDHLPSAIVADAGFGVRDAYHYFFKNSIRPYIPFPGYYQEQKDKRRRKTPSKHPFKKSRLFYNAEQDCYYCPMGQKMSMVREYISTAKGQEGRLLKRYQAQNCEGCPLRGVCHGQKGNRVVDRDEELEGLRSEVRVFLETEKAKSLAKRRSHDVEGIFGHIKHNKGFKRFLTRGIENVETELGLLFTSINLGKVCRLLGKVCPIPSQSPKNNPITAFLATS